MDVTRLQELASTVIAEYDRQRIVKVLSGVENAYLASVQTPSNETAAALDGASIVFFESADAMKELPPPRLAMLDQLFAGDLYGHGLADRVKTTLSAGISPATVVAGLAELKRRMAKFRSDLEGVKTGLDSLGLVVSESQATEAEADILLPGQLYSGSLDGLAQESDRLNTALLVLVEAATGSRPALAVKSISTGSLQLVLSIDTASGALIMQVTTFILSSIVSFLAIRKTMLELERLKSPQVAQDLNRKWYDDQIAAKWDELTKDIQSRIKDEGRRNELSSPTANAIKYLADRMDRGMRINIELPPRPSEEEPTKEQQQIAELQVKAIEMAAQIKRLAPAESILSLPAAVTVSDVAAV